MPLDYVEYLAVYSVYQRNKIILTLTCAGMDIWAVYLKCIHSAIFYVSHFILLTLEQYQIIAITMTRPRREFRQMKPRI